MKPTILATQTDVLEISKVVNDLKTTVESQGETLEQSKKMLSISHNETQTNEPLGTNTSEFTSPTEILEHME